MNRVKIFLTVIALGLILALAGPVPVTSAQVPDTVHIRIPPPPRAHDMPAPRPDSISVWIPGYQEYDPGMEAYVWHPGWWDHPPKKGAKWIPPKYKRQHGEYKFIPGRWK